MPHAKKRIRTLVVDDSADFVRAIGSFLDILPNVDVIAKGRSGHEAIVLAHEWMPDILDLR
jgi:chemotaxis response regulator CheB